MIIRTLVTKNFRSLEDDSTYIFSEGVNVIEGENGVGKTSIMLAIAYVLTGLDGTGSKSTTHYMRNQNTPMEVKIIIENDNGQKLSLTMIETVAEKKLLMNNREIKRSVFEKEMKLDQDIVLATLLPDFFDTVSEKKMEEIIGRCLPEIDRTILVKQYVQQKDLDACSLMLNLSEPKSSLTNITKQRLSLEKMITELEGQIVGVEAAKAQMAISEKEKLSDYNPRAHNDVKRQLDDIGIYKKNIKNYEGCLAAEKLMIECEEKIARLKVVNAPVVPPEYQAQLDAYNDYMKKRMELEGGVNRYKTQADMKDRFKVESVDLNKEQELIRINHEMENQRIDKIKAEQEAEVIKRQQEAMNKDKDKIRESIAINSEILESTRKVELFLKELPKLEWQLKLSSFKNAIDSSIEVKTEERLKNGNTVDCFKITYNGIPYSLCSSGEKIYINRNLSDALAKTSKTKFKTRFFDNVELLTKTINEKLKQSFVARVTDGPLTIKRV